MIAGEVMHGGGQCQVLIQRANIMSDQHLGIPDGLVQMRGERVSNFVKFRRDTAGIELSFDRKDIRMEGVRHGKVKERDARIGLLTSSGHDPNLMAGIHHQARVMTKHTFHPSNYGRRRVVKEGYPGHDDVSRAAWIARSMNTAEDQPNMEAAIGGFSPVTG